MPSLIRPKCHSVLKYSFTYPALLYIFMHIHDPTPLNRHSTQYRSIILYEKGNQLEYEEIKKVLSEVTAQGKYQGYPNKIVTEVKGLEEFYVAEGHHQNYYNENTGQGYCTAIIKPKMGKFKNLFEKYIDLTKF